MWRLLLVCALLAALAVVTMRPEAGAAKDGSVLFISPDTGELGTTIQLGSEYWTPDAEVKVYAGFSPSLHVYDGGIPIAFAEPERFWGPIAITRSGSGDPSWGKWNVSIRVESTPEMPIPQQPGFLFFRAESEGLPPFAEAGNQTDFALVVDGRAPDGAGGIQLTVSVASGIEDQAFLYDIEPAGSDTFYWYPAGLMYANRLKPFEVTLPRRSNGDYHLFVQPIGRREVIGPGVFESIRAQMCFAPPLGCNTPGEFIVKRVSVRNGEITPVEVVLGKPGEAPPLPSAGTGAAPSTIAWSIALLAALSTGGGALRRVLSRAA